MYGVAPLIQQCRTKRDCATWIGRDDYWTVTMMFHHLLRYPPSNFPLQSNMRILVVGFLLHQVSTQHLLVQPILDFLAQLGLMVTSLQSQ
jgi:hypothetical protein